MRRRKEAVEHVRVNKIACTHTRATTILPSRGTDGDGHRHSSAGNGPNTLQLGMLCPDWRSSAGSGLYDRQAAPGRKPIQAQISPGTEVSVIDKWYLDKGYSPTVTVLRTNGANMYKVRQKDGKEYTIEGSGLAALVVDVPARADATGTWFWNNWENVELRKGGEFWASNCTSGGTWTQQGLEVRIYWRSKDTGTWGRHPGLHMVVVSEDGLKLQGKRYDGDACDADRVNFAQGDSVESVDARFHWGCKWRAGRIEEVDETREPTPFKVRWDSTGGICWRAGGQLRHRAGGYINSFNGIRLDDSVKDSVIWDGEEAFCLKCVKEAERYLFPPTSKRWQPLVEGQHTKPLTLSLLAARLHKAKSKKEWYKTLPEDILCLILEMAFFDLTMRQCFSLFDFRAARKMKKKLKFVGWPNVLKVRYAKMDTTALKQTVAIQPDGRHELIHLNPLVRQRGDTQQTIAYTMQSAWVGRRGSPGRSLRTFGGFGGYPEWSALSGVGRRRIYFCSQRRRWVYMASVGDRGSKECSPIPLTYSASEFVMPWNALNPIRERFPTLESIVLAHYRPLFRAMESFKDLGILIMQFVGYRYDDLFTYIEFDSGEKIDFLEPAPAT